MVWPLVTVCGEEVLTSVSSVPAGPAGTAGGDTGGAGGSGGPDGSGGTGGVGVTGGVGGIGGIGVSGTTTIVRVSSRLGCGSGSGSGWSPDTVATFGSRVPPGVSDDTVAVIVSVSDEPAAGAAGTLGAVQVILPLDPTGGVMQVRAGSWVALTKSTPGGS